ncbi:glycoside hydrolase family 43 protein [Sorangium sp. So ce134]
MARKSGLLLGALLALTFIGCSSSDDGARDAATGGTGGGPAGGTGSATGGTSATGSSESASGSTTGSAGGPAGSGGGAASSGTGGAGAGGTGGGPPETPSCMGSVAKKVPLVDDPFTADPSAHVFDGKLYFYPSHDIDSGIPEDNDGSHFDMKDYHVYSFDDTTCAITDHGVALALSGVPWAQKQLWAPDAAYKNGTYYLVFPAKDKSGIFRIGIATSSSPTGPFTAEPQPIAGSFSIDPALFIDDDGSAYLYFGGLMGGQLERWRTGEYNAGGRGPGNNEPALGPRVAKLSADLKSIDGSVSEIRINDANGSALTAGDTNRRFFEAAWLHKRNGVYYLSYSTGDTHYIVYATSDNPTGPFTYRGRVLSPPSGWTTHHSIVEFKGDWFLFYHENANSGKTHLRSVELADLTYAEDGSIPTITP